MQDQVDYPCTISMDDGRLRFSGTFDIVLCKYRGDEVGFDEEMGRWIGDKSAYREFTEKWSDLHASRYARMDHIFLSDQTEDEKARLLTTFYRRKQDEVFANRRVIEDHFWTWFMDYTKACGYPFYGASPDGPVEPYILPELMPPGRFADNDDLWDAIMETWTEGLGGLEGMRRNLPMVDTGDLLSTVYPQGLVLEGDVMRFQLSSDVCSGMLLCATYAEIHQDYSFHDWHNC